MLTTTQRIVLLFIFPLFINIQGYSQDKNTTTSSIEQQLMELRLQQQYLEKKVDDQKSSLEEKYDIKKENLEYKRDETNGWISLFGLVVTVIGIGLPVIGYILGKRIVADIDSQKNNLEEKIVNIQTSITQKQKEIEEKYKEQLDWVEMQKIEYKEIHEKYKSEMDVMKSNLKQLLSEAKCDRDEIKEVKDSIKPELYQIDESEEFNNLDKDTYSNKITTNLSEVKTLLIKAEKEYNENKHTKSIDIYKSILAKYSNNLTDDLIAEVYNRIANSYWPLNDYENSLKYSKKALSLSPTNAIAAYNTGITYAKMNLYEDAIEYLNKTVELKPEFFEAYNMLGNIHLLNKRYTESINSFNKALSLKPNDDMIYHHLGIASFSNKNTTDAIAYFNKGLEINPNNESIIINIAVAHIQEDNFDTAKEYLEKALKINSQIKEVWYNLGVISHNKNNYEEALNNYEKAIEIDNLYYSALTNAGVVSTAIASKNKDYHNAINYFERAYQINDMNNDLNIRLARVYAQNKQYDDAIKMYKKILEIDNNNNEALADFAELQLVKNLACNETLDRFQKNAREVIHLFSYHLIDIIYKIKNNTYKNTIEEAFAQLQQTVNNDTSKVNWNFDILKDWLIREEQEPKVLDERSRLLINQLIMRIEEWRKSENRKE